MFISLSLRLAKIPCQKSLTEWVGRLDKSPFLCYIYLFFKVPNRATSFENDRGVPINM